MTPGWSTSWSVIFDKNKYLETVWRNILTCGMIFLHTNKATQMALPDLIENKLYLTSENISKAQITESFLFQELSVNISLVRKYNASSLSDLREQFIRQC